MQQMKKMKNISGSFSKTVLLLLFLSIAGRISAQDTLRTFGPRFGIDLSRLIYLFATPPQLGAEFSADFEVYKNIYPVFEAGYNSISESREMFDYASGGSYARAGVDYNILPHKDRAVQNTITVGLRYGLSLFTHKSENVVIPGNYWGDYMPEPYENSLRGQWMEVVGGMKVEVVPNLFLGWSLRFKFLLNPDMDPVMIPELIPGYGKGTESRTAGFSYSIFYRIPMIKK
jgi:hypothetical protein